MKIADLPLHKRPREKLILKGSDGLSEGELLAILLRTGYQGKSSLEVAERILQKYSLNELFNLKLEKLSQIKGVGPTRASLLLAVAALYQRLQPDIQNPIISAPKDVVQLTQFLKNKKQEYLVVLYLNARHQLLVQETITIGTLNSSLIHGREVFAPAIVHRAAFVILVHNHPSGNAYPSADDIEVTEKLQDIGELLDIPVIDHVIIAEDGWCSLKEEKLL
jgi:DNA repair protein RadC